MGSPGSWTPPQGRGGGSLTFESVLQEWLVQGAKLATQQGQVRKSSPTSS